MRLIVAAGLLALGCGADAGESSAGPGDVHPDGGGEGEGEPAGAVDVSTVAVGAPTEPPALPAPPFEPRVTDWSCPAGWGPSPTFREGVASELIPERIGAHTHCRPPAPPAEACPPGQIRRLGEALCVPHGVACPTVGVDWATEEELRARAPGFDGALLYAAARGRQGSGTRDDPYPSISDAIGEAAPGDVVALAPGQYVEEVTFAGGIALLGACVAQTAIVAPRAQIDAIPRATVEVRESGGTLIADLTITGAAAGMSVRGRDGDVTLRSLRFDATAFLALNVAEGPGIVTGEDLSFMGTTPVQQEWGRGVLAVREGKIRLIRPSFHGNVYGAMGAHQPFSWVEAEDAIVTGTSAQPLDGAGGFAMLATAGGRMELRRGWFDSNQSADIGGSSAGAIPGEPTLIDVADLVVRETRPGEPPFIGSAFQVADGTHVIARRVLVEGTGGSLVFASHRGTELQFEDVVVRDRDGAASGLSLAIGAQASVRRMIVTGVTGCWAEVVGPFLPGAPRDQGPPVGLFEDLVVTGERAIFGAHALRGAHFTLRRALLVGNAHHLATIRVQDPETVATLEDVRIAEIAPAPMRELDPDDRVGPVIEDVAISGIGVWVTHGATVTAKRLSVRDVTTFGLVVSAGGASVRAEDLEIFGVAPHPVLTERGGHGIHLQVTARLVAERVHVRDVGGFGIVVVGEDPGVLALGGAPEVILSDLTLEDVGPIPSTTAADGSGGDGGIGLISAGPGRTELSNFVIRRASLAGVMVAAGADLTAADGVIEHNLIGLNIQDGSFHWEGALQRVAFRNNTLPIDAVTVPVPDAGAALEQIRF